MRLGHAACQPHCKRGSQRHVTGATLRGMALLLYFLQASDWQKPSSLFFSREENTCFLGQAIFAKQKTKKGKKKNDRHVIKTTKETKYATHDLLAVLSGMLLYVLIIACCLCYIGRHGWRAS
jgi:hypothetical protein